MKKINKAISVSAAMLLACSAMSVTAFAAENDSANVFVTISDANGQLVVIQEEIEVTDIDSDGALTINDALYLAHEAEFEGGAAAGYSSSVGQYGLALDKLWGTQNGGSYGYFVNNESAWSLADTVSDGDYVNAFVYTDLDGYSDAYSWFDVTTLDAEQGDEVELTLSRIGYDADWNPVNVLVEGAVITINGEETEFRTDAEGKVTVTLDTAGEVLISAKSDSLTLVPPAVKVQVEGEAPVAVTTTKAPAAASTTTAVSTTAKATTTSNGTASPKTGDSGVGAAIAVLGAAVAAGFIVRRRNED